MNRGYDVATGRSVRRPPGTCGWWSDDRRATEGERSPDPRGGSRASRASAVRVPAAARVHRAGLDPAPRLPGRDEGAVGVGAVAARPHDQEPRRVEAGARRPARRRPIRGHRARPAGARDDVDAPPAADGEHDGRRRPARRSRASLHGAGARRTAPTSSHRTRWRRGTRCTRPTCGRSRGSPTGTRRRSSPS